MRYRKGPWHWGQGAAAPAVGCSPGAAARTCAVRAHHGQKHSWQWSQNQGMWSGVPPNWFQGESSPQGWPVHAIASGPTIASVSSVSQSSSVWSGTVRST